MVSVHLPAPRLAALLVLVALGLPTATVQLPGSRQLMNNPATTCTNAACSCSGVGWDVTKCLSFPCTAYSNGKAPLVVSDTCDWSNILVFDSSTGACLGRREHESGGINTIKDLECGKTYMIGVKQGNFGKVGTAKCGTSLNYAAKGSTRLPSSYCDAPSSLRDLCQWCYSSFTVTCGNKDAYGRPIVCRAAKNGCDKPEELTDKCTCPPDAFQSSSTPCSFGKSQGGACDSVDYCSGTAATCVDKFKSKGTSCKGTNNDGKCDAPDECSGYSGTCVDKYLTAGTICRGAVNECDLPEVCTGTSSHCPDDKYVTDTTKKCPGKGTSNGKQCDDDPNDHCSGTSAKCVDAFKTPGTSCKGTLNDQLCDGDDKCDDKGKCIDKVKPKGTPCRDPAGPCDEPEVCPGDAYGVPNPRSCPDPKYTCGGGPQNAGLYTCSKK